MTSCLLDTNHVSAILKNNQKLIARMKASGDSEFGLARPSVGELWFMVFNSAKIQGNAANLDHLLQGFLVLEFDEVAAKEFGRIKSELRKVGRPIPDVDSQIASIARVSNLALLTADARFEAVAGLTFENWLA